MQLFFLKNYKQRKNIIISSNVTILEENVLQETEENFLQQMLGTLKI